MSTKTKFTRVVVAVDGSGNSKRASQRAARLAQRYDAELIVLNVIDGRAYDRNPAKAEKRAREIVDENVTSAKRFPISVKGETIRPGDSTVEQIINYARNKKGDLIVVGTRGLGGFKRMLLGSISSGVVTHAHSPVLVVR